MSMNSNKEQILESVIEEIPRLLSLLDRNCFSKTYGSFDRHFWHYKTVDFPGGRYQEAILTIALLYTINSPNNCYYNNLQIKEWINASLNFWCLIQEKTGSFNEWYPFEDSFVTTAFTTYAISEVLLYVPEVVSNKKRLLFHLRKAANWLLNNSEVKVINQLSGSTIALYNLYLLTKENKFLQGSKTKIDHIIKTQSEEGWWYEYEGPDIGYLSLMIDYLSKYYLKSNDRRLKPVLDKALNFLQYFIHPDGSSGGEYASRNTEYLIPSGFFALAKESKTASAISRVIEDNIINGRGISPGQLDDRYLCYISYNWLQAYLSYNKPNKEKLPCEFDNLRLVMKKSQISITGNENFYLIVNALKGGSFSLFFKTNNTKYVESGLIQKTRKDFFSNSRISSRNRFLSSDGLSLKSEFFLLKSNVMNSFKLILLRGFQQVFGRVSFINKFTKKILRNLLISKKDSGKGYLVRKIFVTNSSLILQDSIRLVNGAKELIVGDKFSDLYVPSSRYFQIFELQVEPNKYVLRNKTQVELERSFSSNGAFDIKLKCISQD